MSEDKPARPRLPTAQHDLMGKPGKPYAWIDGNSRIQSKQIDPLVDIPLYKKPQWRGLTLEDIDDIGVSKDWVAGARWAEAKLKEKNT